MTAMEGVEGVPVLFVAWNQPDVFRLGSGFKFQTLVRNCLECERKYGILKLEYFNTQQVVDISWKTLEGKHYLELVQTHEIHLSSLYFRWFLLKALFLESHW